MARTRGSRADITGPLIRDHALRLIARHGYAAVSMRKLADAVGVQVGTLYGHIPDKQALLMDLMRSHMETLLDAWHDDAGATPVRRLERFVRFHIAYSLDQSDGVFLSYMELRNLEPDNFHEIGALRRRYEDSLERILKDGVACGTMQVADTRLTTMALIAMLTGVTNWYRAGGRLDRETLSDVYWGLVQGAVGVA